MQLCPILALSWLHPALDPCPWYPSCSPCDGISVTMMRSVSPLDWCEEGALCPWDPSGSKHILHSQSWRRSLSKAGPGTAGSLDGISPSLLVEGQSSEHFQGFDQCIINKNQLMIALPIQWSLLEFMGLQDIFSSKTFNLQISSPLILNCYVFWQPGQRINPQNQNGFLKLSLSKELRTEDTVRVSLLKSKINSAGQILSQHKSVQLHSDKVDSVFYYLWNWYWEFYNFVSLLFNVCKGP